MTTNLDANAVLTSTFGAEYRALPIAHREALIADLIDLVATTGESVEAGGRTLAWRLAPAPLASYTATLIAGQVAARRRLDARLLGPFRTRR